MSEKLLNKVLNKSRDYYSLVYKKHLVLRVRNKEFPVVECTYYFKLRNGNTLSNFYSIDNIQLSYDGINPIISACEDKHKPSDVRTDLALLWHYKKDYETDDETAFYFNIIDVRGSSLIADNENIDYGCLFLNCLIPQAKGGNYSEYAVFVAFDKGVNENMPTYIQLTSANERIMIRELVRNIYQRSLDTSKEMIVDERTKLSDTKLIY